jgi:prepilin-type processing-associated H-X9-DG protein
VALLISILLPALGKARAAARVSQCSTNVRQIGMAMIMWADANKQYLPYNGNKRTIENCDLEYTLRGFLGNTSRQYNGTGGVNVTGGVFLCPSSNMFVEPDGSGGTRYVTRGDAAYMDYTDNSYSGLYYHWSFQHSSNKGPTYIMSFFSRPSGVPIQFCSTNRVLTNGVYGSTWHANGPRPVVFLDGHAKAIGGDAYTIDDSIEQCMIRANGRYNGVSPHSYRNLGMSLNGYNLYNEADFALGEY